MMTYLLTNLQPVAHRGAELELAEELLVRGEQAPRLAHARRAVEALREPGVPQDLDQQLHIQAVEESRALCATPTPHTSHGLEMAGPTQAWFDC